MREQLTLIGLGLAGRAIALRLVQAGYWVAGYDLRQEACAAAAQLGVKGAADARAAVAGAPVVLLSLPDSDVVRGVLWGEAGIAEVLAPGALVLDTTTGRPADARNNHTRLAALGVRFVDVALSGSSEELARGSATALVGDTREQADYHAIVATFADPVLYLGAPGAGSLAKLVVNLVMGLNRAALAEGLALGERAGLDPGGLLEVLRRSAAYSRVMDLKGRRMVERDFEPASRIAQHAKDVALILELAAQVGASTPLEETHAALLDEALTQGWGGLDNAGLIKVYLAARGPCETGVE